MGAELSAGAGLIDTPEHALPAATARLQERVVLDEQAPVGRGEADLASLEMALDFAAVVVEFLFDLRFGAGLFLEDDLAGDLLDVGVLQLDRDREPGLEALELGGAGE